MTGQTRELLLLFFTFFLYFYCCYYYYYYYCYCCCCCCCCCYYYYYHYYYYYYLLLLYYYYHYYYYNHYKHNNTNKMSLPDIRVLFLFLVSKSLSRRKGRSVHRSQNFLHRVASLSVGRSVSHLFSPMAVHWQLASRLCPLIPSNRPRHRPRHSPALFTGRDL